MARQRTLRGALAGAAAALLWAAQQPLDKRLFGTRYDDVELLGKLVTRGSAWPAAGLALHVQNGAIFGAAYANLRPLLPGPPAARGAALALAEHVATWPLTRLTDRRHPAREELEPLGGNRSAWLQSAWRHILFGALLGELERRLNPARHDEPLGQVPASSNGHGDLSAVTAAAAT